MYPVIYLEILKLENGDASMGERSHSPVGLFLAPRSRLTAARS